MFGYSYRIWSNTCPGIYFLPDSVDPALKLDRLLNRTGVYKPTRPRANFFDDVIDSMGSEGSDSYMYREDECDQRTSYIQVRLDSFYQGGTSC